MVSIPWSQLEECVMDRKWLWICTLLVFAAGAAACGEATDEGASLRQGMTMICESPNRVTAAVDEERAASASRWIASHLKNQEARELFVALASLPPWEKASREHDVLRRSSDAPS
jgi:hypothetical protein